MFYIGNLMLDGTLCEQCGSFIDFECVGHTRLCDECTDEKMYDKWDNDDKMDTSYEELEPFHKDFYEY